MVLRSMWDFELLTSDLLYTSRDAARCTKTSTTVWIFFLLTKEGFSLAQKIKDGGDGPKGGRPTEQSRNNRHCGTWVRKLDGGSFSSPNYPNTYPPNKECLYVLEGNQ
ncbi:hypothetical protein AMECASPLE_032399 [Ameca splendens]|uniref:CUB domain-containing protein n=1 Tax=Ameca splendens TaxID=208324 RepID=A0ABV0YTS4_9TELE